MIIGGSKAAVIEHIKELSNAGELNAKAELTDPVFTPEQTEAALKNFKKVRKNRLWFALKNNFTYLATNWLAREAWSTSEVEGLEKLDGLKGGAIITANHFNPLDSMAPRKMAKKKFHKNPYIVVQVTNLALPGFLGFLMNHLNTIPLAPSPHYIKKEFLPELKKLLKNGELVLIYPEEEMWFNYRKPRPCKRGAYQFAAETGAPVISTFTEIIDLSEPDNEEFNKVRYVSHVLGVIKPDPNLSVRENSKQMAEKDYQLRLEAYEKCYGKKLDYKFEQADIAGYNWK